MKLLVVLPDDVATTYGVDRVLKVDLDAFLRLPLDELTELEDTMGYGLQRIRIDAAEYRSRTVRAVAWLALRAAGKKPDWDTFAPDLVETTYARDMPADDADPPARGGSSTEEPAASSSSTARRSRGSSASPRTRSQSSK